MLNHKSPLRAIISARRSKMDAGREAILNDRKATRAKEVKIQFTDKTYTNFVVLDNEGSAKYNGSIIQDDPHIDDFCSCPNFTPLNHERFQAEHGYAYQCKHLIAAHEVRRTVEQVQILAKETKQEESFESALVQKDLLLP